ncbi:DoxX family protein [Polaribacter sp.]|nr:DoxX family protein [Polaribacter sp.]
MNLFLLLTCFTAVAFLIFGINCFTSPFIKNEFKRYGLPKVRTLIGALQVLGAVGLIIGYYYNPVLLLLSSTGLFILMTAGFIVRLKVKDNFVKSSPAFTFAAINLFIALKTYANFFG